MSKSITEFAYTLLITFDGVEPYERGFHTKEMLQEYVDGVTLGLRHAENLRTMEVLTVESEPFYPPASEPVGEADEQQAPAGVGERAA